MKGKGMKVLSCLAAGTAAFVASAAEMAMTPLAGENWWGLGTHLGTKMPFGGESIRAVDGRSIDLRKSNYGNQAAPFMLSDKGRYVWSDEPFAVDWTNGVFRFEGEGPFELETAPMKTLRGAFLAAAAKHFSPSGKTPDLALIAAPQWNTWVELTYDQNEKDILAYAKAVKDNGFPGGVLMIDDTWQYGYGIWEFDPRRFRDPKGMIDKLHADGWKVMLWICPFVSMDSPGYREMTFGWTNGGRKCEKGGLMMENEEDPAAAKWWNGRSAVLDLTHPNGCRWFSSAMRKLQDDFGVDGWKLDAGDTSVYKPEWKAQGKTSSAGHCEAYAKIGLEFPLNEYRACWKMGGQPLVQRLCDKDHSWGALEMLVPDMIAAGLIGHPFVCPDMIGSGSWLAFSPDAPDPYDPELFVRSAQIHALCPMMQFSAAPWRLLKGEHLEAVKAATALRMKFTPYILEVAKASAKSGEPMLRSMEYSFPGNGWAKVNDQFMMGDDLLVAPQTKKDAPTREVAIPPGSWRADDGTVFAGPRVVSVATPLARLPHFTRVK